MNLITYENPTRRRSYEAKAPKSYTYLVHTNDYSMPLK